MPAILSDRSIAVSPARCSIDQLVHSCTPITKRTPGTEIVTGPDRSVSCPDRAWDEHTRWRQIAVNQQRTLWTKRTVVLAHPPGRSEPGRSGYAQNIRLIAPHQGEYGAYKEHSVDVVDIAILPPSVEKGIFRDRDLRTIEHGRLRLAQLMVDQKRNSLHSCRSRCIDWKPIPAD